ncbi:MAG: aminoglycoside 6'-N-acetyltransferase [Lysobacter sp.]
MSEPWLVRAATRADLQAWAQLRHALWPDADAAAHADDIEDFLQRGEAVAAFVAVQAPGELFGFAEASLRHDYVNGTDSSPVAFVEGWYVQPSSQRRGAGRALIAAIESWARERGCSELASDALLDNLDAHRAHEACGFEETERVVYFRRALD